MLQDVHLQLLVVGTGELVHDFLALDEQEGGHTGDFVLGGQIFALVHVDLDDEHLLGVLVLEFLQLGGNHLAGAAPGGEKVHHDELVAGGFQLAVEVSLQTERERESNREMPDKNRSL